MRDSDLKNMLEASERVIANLKKENKQLREDLYESETKRANSRAITRELRADLKQEKFEHKITAVELKNEKLKVTLKTTELTRIKKQVRELAEVVADREIAISDKNKHIEKLLKDKNRLLTQVEDALAVLMPNKDGTEQYSMNKKFCMCLDILSNDPEILAYQEG